LERPLKQHKQTRIIHHKSNTRKCTTNEILVKEQYLVQMSSWQKRSRHSQANISFTESKTGK